MTRKDYQLIADAIACGIKAERAYLTGNPKCPEGNAALKAQEMVASRIASSLEIENPRLDRALFLNACGVEAAMRGRNEY